MFVQASLCLKVFGSRERRDRLIQIGPRLAVDLARRKAGAVEQHLRLDQVRADGGLGELLRRPLRVIDGRHVERAAGRGTGQQHKDGDSGEKRAHRATTTSRINKHSEYELFRLEAYGHLAACAVSKSKWRLREFRARLTNGQSFDAANSGWPIKTGPLRPSDPALTTCTNAKPKQRLWFRWRITMCRIIAAL